MKDNSVGPDIVPGSGGASGSVVSGSGGTSPLPPGSGGSGGAAAVTSSGGANGGGTGGGSGTGGSTISNSGGAAPASGGMSSGGSPATGGRGGSVGSGGAGTPDAGADTRAATGGMVGPIGDAGTTTGAIVAGGESKCATSTAKLCDGFEGAAVGAADSPWKAEVAGTSTVAVDTTKPFRGTKAAHLSFKAAQAFITETQTFSPTATAAVNDEMWGRMFVWYEFSAGTAQGHFVFMRAEGTVAAGAAAASSQLHIAGGYQMKFAAEIRTTTDLYKYATPNIMVPQTPARWQCWEWHTTGANTMDFYIDGKMVPGMSVAAADKWPFPNFNKLYLGFLQFSASPTGEMWIDEVALGTTQIGCDN